jgi:hypothetical protein
MTPFLPFLIVGTGELWASTHLPLWLGWAVGWAGASTSYVSFAYLVKSPRLLGKLDAPRLATVLLFPFLLFARSAATVVQNRMKKREVELVPGLWVGAWPRAGVPQMAQMDLTAELPRRGEALRYHCVPMLDGDGASDPRYLEAVTKVLAWRREGLPVLVHCAYGHGRSVAVCIGVMIVEGHARTWEEELVQVRQFRPRAHLTTPQRRMLGRLQDRLRANDILPSS